MRVCIYNITILFLCTLFLKIKIQFNISDGIRYMCTFKTINKQFYCNVKLIILHNRIKKNNKLIGLYSFVTLYTLLIDCKVSSCVKKKKLYININKY